MADKDKELNLLFTEQAESFRVQFEYLQNKLKSYNEETLHPHIHILEMFRCLIEGLKGFPLIVQRTVEISNRSKERDVSAEVDAEDLKQAFMLSQYEQVVDEVNGRRLCRSNIFRVTFATVGTISMALIGFIYGFGGVDKARPWVMLGTAVPLIILTIGIFVTIHKARTINIRLGYLGSLSYYLSRGAHVPRTCSWINANRVPDFCAERSRSSTTTLCGKNKTDSCIVLARKAGYKTNKERPLILTEFFKSFTILSTVVYSGLYLVIATAFVWASGFFYNPVGWLWPSLWGALWIAAILLPSFFTALLMSHRRDPKIDISGLEGEKKEEELSYQRRKRFRRVMQTLAVTLIASTVSIIFVSAIIRGIKDEPLDPIMTGLVMACVFLFVLYMAIELFWQVIDLRKGTYSVETYYVLYRWLLKRCPYMYGDGVLRVKQEKIEEIRNKKTKAS